MTRYRLVRLGDCTTIVSGGTPRTSEARYWDGDIPWATPKDLSELDGQIHISGTARLISSEGLRSCAASTLPAGSVLFSSRAPIGHTAINTVPMATNQGFKSFVPDPSQVDARYLLRWLRFSRRQLETLGNGATFKEVSKSIVSAIVVPLPPLSEQRRLAEILDKADALRAKRRAALALLDTLTQSIFLDMLGDLENSPVVTVSDLASTEKHAIRTGPFGSQLLHSEFTGEGIAVLGIDNVVDNEFRWGRRRFISETKYRQLARYTVRPGDVLISIMGTYGRCAVVPADIPLAINTKHLCCITLDRSRCLPEYLHAYFLRHQTAQRFLAGAAKGAIMDGLNMGIIKRLPVILPPLALQENFVRRLQSLAALRAAAHASRAHLDALFASLQHRAFRGEL